MVAGNIADLAIALQPAKGTPATASSHRVYLAGGGVAAVKETADVEESSAGRLRNETFVTVVRANGTPAVVVRPNAIGMFLYGVMGAKAVTGASDPYTHTFTLANTQPWFTVWRMLGGSLFEQFVDCKISTLTIRSAAAGLIMAEIGILGLSPSSQAAAEASVPVETAGAFLHADGEGALLYEGVAAARISSFVLTIDAGMVHQQGPAVTGYDVTEGMHSITIETEEAVADFGTYNRYVYGAASPADGAVPSRSALELGGAPAGIDFKFTRPGAPERSLEFLAPRVQVTGVSGIESNTSGEPIRSTSTHRVLQPAAGSGLTAKLKNSVVSYVAS